MTNLSVFLPCRAGSERVPHKNTKPLATQTKGLIDLKLKQLLDVNSINKIILSTNDPEVVEVGEELKSTKIHINMRPDHLASSETSTDELIKYAAEITSSNHILWTHVTSPFINADVYKDSIDVYFKLLKEGDYDSLMSVNEIRTFIWNKNEPLNYDRSKEKWPRTQTLNPLFEVNSGIFISPKRNYIELGDRIGQKPYLYTLSHLESFDIDWPLDFEIAETIYSSKFMS